MTPRAARGFTILEVMVASLLLVVGLVGSIAMIGGLVSANKSARARDIAYYLVQQTLDQKQMIPLVQAPNFGLANQYAITGNPQPDSQLVEPNAMLCYPMSDDVLADRPIPCTVPLPPSFILRTWTCCASAQLGQNPPVITGGACGPSQAEPLTTSDSGANGQGTVCLVQAEVTWPVEVPNPPGSAPTTFATTPTELFQDNYAPYGLAFQNHVYASVIREQ